LSEPASPDYGKWATAVLVMAVLGSEVFLLRQNRALRSAVQTEAAGARTLRTSVAAEAALVGRCQPMLTALNATTAPRYDVTIYFSLERDCLSCVRDVVSQVNEALRAPGATAFRVHGYTNIDGVTKQQFLDRELAPAFPVTHVDHIEEQLAAKHVDGTPVAYVSDAATGRVLFTYAGTTNSKRPFVKRLQAIATPCAPSL
jgi:hypothetical protein